MINTLLNIIAPEDCIECGREGSLWCNGCRLSDTLLPSRCFLCHVATSNFEVCVKCKKKTAVRRMYVAKEYKENAKDLIYQLKFHPKRHAAEPIGNTIADMLPFYHENTIVVNVPTASRRVRQRGFDHTVSLARGVAKQKGLPFCNVLAHTGSARQVGSSRSQRLEQAKESYRLKNARPIKNKHVVLIDDVVTTGATASAVCRILQAAGAKSVDCAVFAYSK